VTCEPHRHLSLSRLCVWTETHFRMQGNNWHHYAPFTRRHCTKHSRRQGSEHLSLTAPTVGHDCFHQHLSGPIIDNINTLRPTSAKFSTQHPWFQSRQEQDSSLPQIFQVGPRVQSSSYPMGNGGLSFFRRQSAGTWSQPPASASAKRKVHCTTQTASFPARAQFNELRARPVDLPAVPGPRHYGL
jgi:hypothetical protein